MEMEVKKTITQKLNLEILDVSAGVRYWEDSSFNDVEDEKGELVPLRKGDYWCPQIEIATGTIQNWPIGVSAKIHYKVCDDGTYILRDKDGNEVLKKEGYVPDCLATDGEGFGDYIIMHITSEGIIEDWKFTHKHLREFEDEE